MFHHVSQQPRRPAPTPKPPSDEPALHFLREPFANLETLVVPRYASRSQQDPHHEQGAVEPPQHTSSLERAIAGLNAKITFGHIGTLATLATFACAGISGLLQATSVLTLSTLALLSANRLRIRDKHHNQAMDELLSEPTSIHHPDSFVRAQSIVRPLCQRHNIPEPCIVIAPESSPNAAMMDRLQGRDVLLLTTGILRILTDRELTAVIAHEVAHQDRWYTRLHHFTATLFAWTKPMAMWGTAFLTLGAIAPSTGYVMAAPVAIATTILTSLAVAFNMNLFSNYVSRHNEIKTDLRACAMTGDPEALISALRKLEPTSPAYQEALNRRARLGLLTHPSFEERARAIRRVFGTSDHTK